jgi:hypothetical protein
MVWEQKGRITRLREAGRDTWDAQRILLLLEANLQKLQEHKTKAAARRRHRSLIKKMPARASRLRDHGGASPRRSPLTLWNAARKSLPAVPFSRRCISLPVLNAG